MSLSMWLLAQVLLGIPGVSRLLTSGQRRSAREGAPLIADLVKLAGTRVQIMAGGEPGVWG